MSSTAGEHNPLALYSSGPSLLSLPQLPEAPCSVNCFFEVNGMKAQATGRGYTPQEAAQNLKGTMHETRALLSAPLTFEQKVSRIAGKMIYEAALEENYRRIERIGLAVSLVVHGSVFEHPENDDMYVVWDHEEIEQEFVHKTYGCGCDNHHNCGQRGCEHALAVAIALECNAVGGTEIHKGE